MSLRHSYRVPKWRDCVTWLQSAGPDESNFGSCFTLEFGQCIRFFRGSLPRFGNVLPRPVPLAFPGRLICIFLLFEKQEKPLLEVCPTLREIWGNAQSALLSPIWQEPFFLDACFAESSQCLSGESMEWNFNLTPFRQVGHGEAIDQSSVVSVGVERCRELSRANLCAKCST